MTDVVYAVKSWVDSNNNQRINLYYADRVEQLVVPSK